ncbi:hypothetical protein [Enterovibrio norvegicus]|uniref:hypothetical protein n=1 Tax=Enterovibrio norvegicus TaxID=188144 RepID=UPI0024B05713|nr:hypothetical protein [Enterovibrio norvegicus]
MSQKVSLNHWLHNALIEKDMDGFSILEIRDCFLTDEGEELDKRELRLTLYRQIYKLVERGYLRKEGKSASQSVRYFKTERFFSFEYIAAKRTKLPLEQAAVALKIEDGEAHFLAQISRDKAQSEAELRITLGEVEEYKRVLALYPEKKALIEPLYIKTKEYSAELLGRINALSKLVVSQC